MNILIIGAGGREHALAWKMAQSHQSGDIYIAPGNPGTAEFGTNVPIQVNDFETLKALAIEKNIELIVVGPEEPLVNGIYDYFSADPVAKPSASTLCKDTKFLLLVMQNLPLKIMRQV